MLNLNKKEKKYEPSDSPFKFQETDARVFAISENSYVVTFFDVKSVANYHNIGVIEAFEKIVEAHELSLENTEIMLEYYDSIPEIKNAIQRQKDSIRIYKQKGQLDRARILEISVQKLEKELTKMYEKERDERAAQKV